MGSLSVFAHRRLVHWQGLLLLVSLLTFWSPPTTAEISIVWTYAPEGEDVCLRIYNKPAEAVGFVWYKGNSVDKSNIIAFSMMTSSYFLSGPENNGREIVTNDGSLLLKNVTMNDTGTYTVVVQLPDSETEIGSGLLHVYEHLRVPILVASNNQLREKEDRVILTCYTRGISIRWLFNDMYLPFGNRMMLTRDGKRLTIDPVKREDAGFYKCMASNSVMRVESQPLELRVLH